tara:strand:- start:18990 stop:22667 length:3678 start_codon:yes stop_codon:yes gene_type:complete
MNRNQIVFIGAGFIRHFYIVAFLTTGSFLPMLAQAQFAGGIGTEGDPYQISTSVQLDSARNYPSSYFVLTANIDMDVAPYNTGSGWTPLGSGFGTQFSGSIDGDGHTISNLYINAGSSFEMSLIGYLNGGTIQDLSLEDVDIIGSGNTGALVGYNDGGSILRCSATGTVSGGQDTGGLVGVNNNGYISESYAIVDVNGNFNQNIGGLVGYHNSGKIENSYALGDVTNGGSTGALFGLADDSVKTSYGGGNVTGMFDVFGLGTSFGSSVVKSYYDLLGTGQSSGPGIGLSGLEIIDEDTYTDWDFSTIWSISGGQYPTLINNPRSESFSPNLFAGGEGTSANPYQIVSVDQLNVLHDSLNNDFKLTANLDLSMATGDVSGDYWNSGSGWEPIGTTSTPFDGSFDGNGFSISGLYIERSGTDNVGLFGAIDSDGVIENLELTDVDITGNDYVGAVAGRSAGQIEDPELSNIEINGNDYVGGVAGLNTGVIKNGQATVIVNGNDIIGGVTGINQDSLYSMNLDVTITGVTDLGGATGKNTGTIEKLTVTSTITTHQGDEGSFRVAGLVGENSGAISKSYINTKISTSATDAGTFAGIAGSNDSGSISEVFAFVDITGKTGVAGMVGSLTNGSIENVYVMGEITGTFGTSGVIGGGFEATVTKSYTTVNILDDTESGGYSSFSNNTGSQVYWNPTLMGIDTTTTGSEPLVKRLTNTQMLDSASYAGFDFDEVWDIYQGSSFPFLRAIGAPHIISGAIITGNNGWRMLSVPFDSITYADLLDDWWTQGVAGADTTGGSPNIYTWNETTQSFEALSDLDTNAEKGEGFIVYVYSDEDADGISEGFPKSIVNQQQTDSSNITLNLSYTDDGDEFTNDDGWNMIGSSFEFPIDWDAASGWGKTNLDNTIYVWSDSANSGEGDYLTWNGSSGTLGNGNITPWQGFWVKANATSPSLTITNETKGEGAVFLKKAATRNLELVFSDDQRKSTAIVMFSSLSEVGNDIYDAYKLQSLNTEYISVYSVGENQEGLEINALPVNITKPIELDLFLESTVENTEFKLNWKLNSIPDHLEIALKNNKTNEVHSLSSNSALKIDIGHQSKNMVKKSGKPTPEVKMKSAANEPIFTLIIKPKGTGTDIETDKQIPDHFTLDQNYPNPFNPSTMIRYGIPESGKVTLEIFDVMGRKVATLINGLVQQAGYHQVEFNASGLASGMYIYQLNTGNTVITRKLTLIK